MLWVAIPDWAPIQRWIPGVESFGCFLSSYSKADEFSEYQVEKLKGDTFFSDLEKPELLFEKRSCFLRKLSEELGPAGSIKAAESLLRKLLEAELAKLKKAAVASLQVSFSDLLIKTLRKPGAGRIRPTGCFTSNAWIQEYDIKLFFLRLTFGRHAG